MDSTTKKRLERTALRKLSSSRSDEEPWSFLFRTDGSESISYCPWTVAQDWPFDGGTDGLDLPWSDKRRAAIDKGEQPTVEELRQWQRAMCRYLANGSDHAHISWIVPIRTRARIEAYALFLCGNADTPSDEEPQLVGVYETRSHAKAALRRRGAFASGRGRGETRAMVSGLNYLLHQPPSWLKDHHPLTMGDILKRLAALKSRGLSAKERKYLAAMRLVADRELFLADFLNDALNQGWEIRAKHYDSNDSPAGWFGIHRFCALYVVNFTQHGEGQVAYGPFQTRKEANAVFKTVVAHNLP